MKLKLKTILFCVITFFIAQNSFAQAGYEDVVYLKNGSVIHGIIVEQIPNESIKIRTRHKDIYVFKMDEIEKIVKKQTVMHRRGRDKPIAKRDTSTGPYTGYVLNIESQIGPGIEKHNAGQPAYAIHVINGVMVNSVFSAGFGVGLDVLNGNRNYGADYQNIFNERKNEYFVGAFFIDLRATPLVRKISPLIILDIGYGKALFSQEIHGGLLLNAGLGTKLNLTRKIGLNLSVNYKTQNILYDLDNSSSTTTINNYKTVGTMSLSYFCLTFGVTL